MESKKPREYLKRGSGQLASQYHWVTEYALKRKDKIILEQEQRENDYKLEEEKKNGIVYEKKD